jgi:uncharacterized protein (DUF697 family)
MLETPEQKADAVIAGMVSTALGMAVIPVFLQVPFMGAMATGVVAIGRCYEITLTKNEGWKLVKEFFKAGGYAFMATVVSGKLISLTVFATGIGYPGAVALDAVTGAAIAYALGAAAKAYFSGEKDRQQLGAIMRQAFSEKKHATV